MAVSYTDDEIEALVRERKRLPQDWEHRTRLKAKRGHHEQYLELTGDAGTRFRLILRQSRINGLDFSIILAVLVPQSTQMFRLRRYNGRSHEHTNQIENQVFYDFHIHFATERYQELGAREDAYAQRTDRYATFRGALDCLFKDANFSVPPRAQGELFDPVGGLR